MPKGYNWPDGPQMLGIAAGYEVEVAELGIAVVVEVVRESVNAYGGGGGQCLEVAGVQ